MNRMIAGPGLRSSAASLASTGNKACIVTGELAGPDFNGGIGITNRALAIALRERGFETDILYTQVHDGKPFSARGSFNEHVIEYRKLGIELYCINHAGEWDDWQAKSYLAMQHLLHHKYDLVFFDDTHGNAYYPLLAQRTGNPHLRATAMCVTAHSATQWIFDLNFTPVRSIESLNQMEMERRSIELANLVKAPSAYILEKYRSYGWSIPEDSIVLPNFIPTKAAGVQKKERIGVNEIVFFGRLETRKGLWMFCRALDRLKFKLTGNIITFLGKPVYEAGVSSAETVLRRSARWPFKIRLLPDFDQKQALRYLKGTGRLAVIASPEDNSPSAMLECLAEEIPFIACAGSGGEELLDERSRITNLFEPSVDALCAKLLEALQQGAQTGRSSFTEKQLDDSFSALIGRMLEAKPALLPPVQNEPKTLPKPILLVIIPERFALLQAAAGIKRIIAAYDGHIEIEALTADPERLRKEFGGEVPFCSINDFHQFEKIAQSMAYRSRTVIGICHITQLLPPSWMARASNCFAQENNISALTGMAANEKEPKEPALDPFFSSFSDTRTPGKYLLGNARALLMLAQSTNDGFLLIRSENLPKLAGLTPFDPQYGRLKAMKTWIHELLAKMALSNERFELVPDLLADRPLQEEEFEVFGLGHLMRSLAKMTFPLGMGSDQTLLAQLAIDSGLEHERARSNAEYLENISEKIGHRVLHWSGPGQTDQLPIVAHANGQIELAAELNAASAFGQKMAGVSDLAAFVSSSANTESLWNRIKINKYKRMNLDQEFSMQLHDYDRRIVLHANSSDKGMAALVFPSLNLAKINRFTSVIWLAKPSSPVRFRLEIIELDKSNHWSTEKVIRGGTTALWEFDCPKELRMDCRVILAVEMADPDYPSNNAFAAWIDPLFVWRK